MSSLPPNLAGDWTGLLGLVGPRTMMLHAPEGDEGLSGSDYDCAVSELDPTWPLRLTGGWSLCQALHYDLLAWYWVLERDGQIALDTLIDPDGLGRERASTKLIFEGDDLGSSPAVRGAYLASKRVRKGVLDEREWKRIGEMARTDEAVFSEALQSIVGSQVAGIISGAAVSGHPPDERAWRRAHTLQLLRRFRTPGRLLRGLTLGFRRTVERVTHPTGLVIAITGPDGAGKSALAGALPEACKGLFRRNSHYHWRPGVLPRPGSFLGRDLSDPSEPHAREAHGRGTSAVLLVYFWIDFLIGTWLRFSLPRTADASCWSNEAGGTSRPIPCGIGSIRRRVCCARARTRRFRAPRSRSPSSATPRYCWTASRSSRVRRWSDSSPIGVTRRSQRSRRAVSMPTVRSRKLSHKRARRDRFDTRVPNGFPSRPGMGKPAEPKQPSLLHPTRRTRSRYGCARGFISRCRNEATSAGLARGVSQRWEASACFVAARRRHSKFGASSRRTSPPRGNIAVRAVEASKSLHRGDSGADGEPRLAAKVATGEAGACQIAAETHTLERVAPLLAPPLVAPESSAPGMASSCRNGASGAHGATWPRWTRKSAFALGTFFASGRDDGGLGPVHGDFAPWNVLQTGNGWFVLDWEAASLTGRAFEDLSHFFVQAHALLGRPSQDDIVAGFRNGTGAVGRAVRAYAAGAGVAADEAEQALSSYLDRSTVVVSRDGGGKRAIEARNRLRRRLAG